MQSHALQVLSLYNAAADSKMSGKRLSHHDCSILFIYDSGDYIKRQYLKQHLT
jgi:hypothetical protein